MVRVVVPVRYPLSGHSRQTLEVAVDVARERNAELTVLHVDLYHDGGTVSRTGLRRAVEDAFGRLPRTRYVVRQGFLVEETILEEVVAADADVVVIGAKQAGRWRRMLGRLTDEPDVEAYLREKLDCEVTTAGGEG